MNNELQTHWWRYDDSWDSVDKDFMERYVSGDLTEQELADMKASQEADEIIDDKIAKARQQYDDEVNMIHIISVTYKNWHIFCRILYKQRIDLQKFDPKYGFSRILRQDKVLF